MFAYVQIACHVSYYKVEVFIHVGKKPSSVLSLEPRACSNIYTKANLKYFFKYSYIVINFIKINQLVKLFNYTVCFISELFPSTSR